MEVPRSAILRLVTPRLGTSARQHGKRLKHWGAHIQEYRTLASPRRTSGSERIGGVMRITEIQEKANEAGAQAWEMTGAVSPSGSAGSTTLCFKRPKL